jgi:hypothetical protein
MNAATATTSIPIAPPRAWFTDPALREVTPLTVTSEGRVFGHLASWRECHLDSGSYGASCVTAPRSRNGYASFMLGAVLTDEGDTIATGPIVLGTPHASVEWNAQTAMHHYSDTGHAVADVRAGEDRHGIWIAGALRPGTTAEQVRALRASPLSGDWRSDPRTGSQELIAALAVNMPGFPIQRPRALVASGGRLLSLLSIGMVPTRDQERAATARAMHLDLLAMDVDVMRATPARRDFAALTSTRDDALIASMGAPGAQVQAWRGVLGVEGLPTGDGRLLAPSSLSAARYPLPLRWAPVDNGGHDGAVIVGRIDGMRREANGAITGWGVIDLGSGAGREAARLIGGNFLSGVSFDLDSTDGEMADSLPVGGEGEQGIFVTSAARIRAATLVAIPAFDEARVELAGDPGYDAFDALVASVLPPLPCGCDSTIQTTIAPAVPALT